MGKLTTSLLGIVLQLYAVGSILADDEIRQVQEALRKRHFFSGNPTGEMSPALSAAVAHYQEKRGFPRTGLIDRETSASLGIARPVPYVAETPVVIETNGAVYGANGEPLPDASVWPADKFPVRFGLTRVESSDLGTVMAVADTELKPAVVHPPKPAPPRIRARTRLRKETNPLVLAFRSVDHFFFGDKDHKKKRGTAKPL
jgi:peptidoglycan hydrolase-like protein with peptidoglycan-binding domain